MYLPRTFLTLTLIALSASAAPKPTAKPPTPPVAPASPASAAPASTAPAPASAPPAAKSAAAPNSTTPSMTAPQVIQLLDKTIDWYRTLGIQQQAASEPSDLLILYDNRQAANRVMSLAFEIARDNAEVLAKQPSAPNSPDAASASQSLSSLQNKFTTQGLGVQSELDAAQRKLPSVPAKQKAELSAKISELQGELALINARKNFLGTMSTFTAESDTSGVSPGALKAQIEAMAITLPAATSTAAPANPSGAASSAAPATSASSTAAPTLNTLANPPVSTTGRFGIWDLAANVFRLSEKLATIRQLDARTSDLQDTFGQLRTPLVDKLKAMSAQGDTLAAAADSAGAGALNQTREQLDSLTDQFKETSGLLIPIGKVGVLLTQYRHNLDNWRDIITKEYHQALSALGIRVSVIVALLTVVFLAAELLRRGVTRYVHDTRRRYQFLLLRRIALWTVVVAIVGFAFASELGSVVTFAGLITAGLAVAMQSVLVSIVGYFFLIGKYGIRVGDRVQIGDVTGEVIELGLVRLHLMELGSKGQSGPTGRVVAFANSIVFQVASGLFKQIPGVNFAWHELTLTLPAGGDYARIKQNLLEAVTAALTDSREEILRQTREIQRTTATDAGGDAQPRVTLAFSSTGVEAHIRYPVHLKNAAEIDERVSQEVSNVVVGAAPIAGTPG
jgi:small-conductance mechanosensitive channel